MLVYPIQGKAQYTHSFVRDSIIKEQSKQKPLPKKVMLRSAIIPGWGQITNKQIWKAPVIYLGLGACIYFIDYNTTNYKDYKNSYILRTDGNPQTIDIHDPLSSSNSEKYNEAQLKIIRDFYHRNLEVTILATAGVYVLNLLDAYISAHLLDFDISDDLTISVKQFEYFNFEGRNYFLSGIELKF